MDVTRLRTRVLSIGPPTHKLLRTRGPAPTEPDPQAATTPVWPRQPRGYGALASPSTKTCSSTARSWRPKELGMVEEKTHTPTPR